MTLLLLRLSLAASGSAPARIAASENGSTATDHGGGVRVTNEMRRARDEHDNHLFATKAGKHHAPGARP